MYYITKTEDNVEEVVSVHPYDNEVKVMTFLNDKYGQMIYSRTKTGSLKATPVNNKDIFFTIVGDKKVEVEKDWRETEDLFVIENNSEQTNIELSSNYADWISSKNEENPLYIEVYDKKSTVYLSLELDEMIKLRDYLNQKIEFLSE